MKNEKTEGKEELSLRFDFCFVSVCSGFSVVLDSFNHGINGRHGTEDHKRIKEDQGGSRRIKEDERRSGRMRWMKEGWRDARHGG
jgi:hypothetical protein